jgi:hypothetical protein
MAHAVTAENSAFSNLEDDQSSGPHFLPTDKHYRLTGEMPGKKDEEEEEVPAAAAPGEQTETPAGEQEEHPAGDEPAAGSKPASEQEPAPAAAKPAAKPAAAAAKPAGENRWQKLSRENRELRERLARNEQAAPREVQPASQPAAEAQPAAPAAAEPRPKIDDVDPKTGKPKYANWAEYEEAKDTWLRKQTIREFQETTARENRAREMQQTEITLGQGLIKKFVPTRAKYADFDAVALNPKLVIPRGSVTDLFLLDSDHAGEVLYHLGKNEQILNGFYADHDVKTGRFRNLISPQQQFRKLMALEAELTGGTAAAGAQAAPGDEDEPPAGGVPAKVVSKAPRPAHQTSGRGSVGKDAVEQAVEEQDQETYNREQNARHLARLKRN